MECVRHEYLVSLGEWIRGGEQLQNSPINNWITSKSSDSITQRDGWEALSFWNPSVKFSCCTDSFWRIRNPAAGAGVMIGFTRDLLLVPYARTAGYDGHFAGRWW